MKEFFHNLVSKMDGGIFIIAEACDNHMGSLEMARALCRVAKESGADAVKFQHHIADEEMLREAEMSDNFDQHLFDFLEENALTLDQHTELKKYCDKIDIIYMCTPFSLQAAKEIHHLVDFFKVGSGEFQDYWFIDGLSKLGLPIIFSSGMSNSREIRDTISYIKEVGLDFALLNCLSEYPPKLEDMNLSYISEMRKSFPDLIIGHSDHTQTTFTSVLAVSLGAQIIEKHLTLSSAISGPDKDVSLTPGRFTELVNDLRRVKKVMGKEKIVQEREAKVRDWAYRSIVTSRNITAGKKIQLEDICTKRPGTGIPSKNYKDILGRLAKVDIEKGRMISWDDVS